MGIRESNEIQCDDSMEGAIEKQVILDSLMMTEVWQESYVRFAFVYLTGHATDFMGSKGKELEQKCVEVYQDIKMKYSIVMEKVNTEEKKENQKEWEIKIREKYI